MTSQERKRFRVRVVMATVATVVVVGGGASMLAHCARNPRVDDASDAELAQGQQLYRTYCGLCHGDEGEGYAADDANALANQDFLVSVSDEFLTQAIAEGHPGTAMAAYHEDRGGPLDDGEIGAIVALIRSWQEEDMAAMPDPGAGDAQRGAQVFAQECASCHGARGQGDTAISLNHPVFLASASDAQIRYAIAKGRGGTPMPAFEGELAEQTIDDLVALIRSWEPSEAPRPTTGGPSAAAVDGPVVINPDGEAPDFPELREGRYVPSEAVADALHQGRRMIILDARTASDYAHFHLPGSIPSPYYEVESIMERLPRDGTWIIAYCACPHAASGRVMDFLREHDFPNTAVLDEGVLHWRDEGFPVVVGDAPGTLEDAE